MQLNIQPGTRVAKASGQISCDLAGEAAILHLADGVYYGLDRVGACVWNMLDQPRSMRELRDGVMATYDVEAERCEHDLAALVQDLMTHGLVEVSNPEADS